MAGEQDRSKRLEYIAKFLLIALFLGGLAFFIGYMTFLGPGWDAFRLSVLDLVLLIFATYRMGHLIAYDLVMEPFRQLFTNTVPDPTGAGESVEPKGSGFQRALGQLVCCPICSGTWVAAVMVYALYLWPEPVRVFLAIMAAVGAAELLNAAGEALSWTGQHQRALSGAHLQVRKKNLIRIEQPCDEKQLPEQEEIEKIPRRAGGAFRFRYSFRRQTRIGVDLLGQAFAVLHQVERHGVPPFYQVAVFKDNSRAKLLQRPPSKTLGIGCVSSPDRISTALSARPLLPMPWESNIRCIGSNRTNCRKAQRLFNRETS